jgi:hypothetical protein
MNSEKKRPAYLLATSPIWIKKVLLFHLHTPVARGGISVHRYLADDKGRGINI